MLAKRIQLDSTIIERLRIEKGFEKQYYRQALAGLTKEGEQGEFLFALRHILAARSNFKIVATRSGMSVTTISNILRPNHNPTLKTVCAIVRALDLTFLPPR